MQPTPGHTGGDICHFKLLNYRYLTIIWWERTQFSNSTFWRLVFSHSWFRIHLQLDFVSLEMNYEPLVWEHQSPKCFGGEPTNSQSYPVNCLPWQYWHVIYMWKKSIKQIVRPASPLYMTGNWLGFKHTSYLNDQKNWKLRNDDCVGPMQKMENNSTVALGMTSSTLWLCGY